jgi:hypothetical protein
MGHKYLWVYRDLEMLKNGSGIEEPAKLKIYCKEAATCIIANFQPQIQELHPRL